MPIRIIPGEVTPTLFVGLGGSGGKAVGRIAKRIQAHEDYDVKFKNLVSFVAIDTNNADLAKLRKGEEGNGRVDSTILISDFDKVAYSELRRGKSFEDADKYFTQWVHEWYDFREDAGAGAGQIRIESRLSFFRSIEVGDVTTKLRDLVGELRSHSHGMRRSGAPLQIFVYFSVAGGTGSGAFLPFAYFIRDLVDDDTARIVGFAILPEAFERHVGMNIEGIRANGYAALKELEHLMKLDTQADKSPERLTFHYDPRNKHKTEVTRRPYDVMYVVDKPGRFSLDNVGEALADATYVQIFSPILGDQQADYDNYTKESRRLFPDFLQARGEGYSAFYGTLGASLLLLPREDLLEYCARRYAGTAVRRYVLLDDPMLVSENQREQFRRFALNEGELKRLSPDEQNRRRDEAFLRKIGLLARQDVEGGVWQRVAKLPETAGGHLSEALQKITDDLRSITSKIREISADTIPDGAWTPGSTLSKLESQMAEARDAIEKRVAAVAEEVESGDWWATFLKAAGPSAAPELNPYEQRYVLVAFREDKDGPLSAPALDALAKDIQRLRTATEMGSESKIRRALTEKSEEIRKTYGGLDKLILRKDKDFEAARDDAIATFNKSVDSCRAFLQRSAAHSILSALGRAADALRSQFRDIELDAVVLAEKLEEEARSYEQRGGVGGRGEANEYTLDVEIFQDPNETTRYWSWYYADQIEARPEFTDDDAVLGAVRDALRPQYDERGQPLKRGARAMVEDIVNELRGTARAILSKEILGDPSSEDETKRRGLGIDEALILEAAYYGRHTEAKGVSPAEVLGDERPLRTSKLWEHPEIQVYVRRKFERAMNKAEPLTKYSAEAKGTIKHAHMLIIGMHPSMKESRITPALEEAVHGTDAQMVEWADSHRMPFYRSILGVPAYCFPHVNEEMKADYQRFQAQEKKAWPLHTDENWEELPNLDPEDRKAELEAEEAGAQISGLAIGVARDKIAHGDEGFALRVGDEQLSLGTDPLAAVAGMTELSASKPRIYDKYITPLLTEAANVAESEAIQAELRSVRTQWEQRCEQLELKASRSPGQEREYKALSQACDLLGAILK